VPSKISLVVNTFQNPDGSPVANGYILIRLCLDGSVDDDQINSNYTQINLNSSGVIIGSPTFWPNIDISPSGTYYIMFVYSSDGQIVSGPLKVTV
jgi:hypothetical protein